MSQSESYVAQHDFVLPVSEQPDKKNEPPLTQAAPNQSATAASPDQAVVAVQDEANEVRRKIRHFEAKIAAVETQIGALQQSMAQAIVQGKSTFRSGDIQKAIRELHADKKELEFRRDDWHLMLTTALSRAARRCLNTRLRIRAGTRRARRACVRNAREPVGEGG